MTIDELQAYVIAGHWRNVRVCCDHCGGIDCIEIEAGLWALPETRVSRGPGGLMHDLLIEVEGCTLPATRGRACGEILRVKLKRSG